MKIIDLLNKIANNEEVPKEVRYKTHYWKYNKERNDYRDEDNDFVFSCSNYDIVDMLMGEIEIIEEKPKKIEKLDIDKNDIAWCEGNMKTDEEMVDIMLEMKNKINEIIDYLLEKESDK
jgi:hypothetical protein